MATTATAVSSGFSDEVTGRPLAGVDEAAEHIARRAFVEAAVGPVGLELESHSVDIAYPHRRVGWRRLQEIANSAASTSAITFEPGGAVELSGPPHTDAASAIASMRTDHRQLVSAFQAQGVALAPWGTDPLRIPERINPAPRYGALASHFGSSGRGRVGLQMMTSTAALQLNLQAGTSGQWRRRLALAQALGPTLVALSASSPMLAGEFTGWRNTRQRIWNQLNPRGCGPIALGPDPAESWARYALDAPVVLVRSPDGNADAVVNDVSFSAWASGQVLLAGRRPTQIDLDYHLTTLFPPVRPRGWLELRYLDAAPESWWPAVAFTAVTALDSPHASDIAAEAVEPVASAWECAARRGLDDPRLRTAAQRLVSAACDEAPAELADDMERLAEQVSQGRCAADDFTDRVDKHGVPQVFCEVSQ